MSVSEIDKLRQLNTTIFQIMFKDELANIKKRVDKEINK